MSINIILLISLFSSEIMNLFRYIEILNLITMRINIYSSSGNERDSSVRITRHYAKQALCVS